MTRDPCLVWRETTADSLGGTRDEKDNGLQYKKAKFVIKGGEKGGKLQVLLVPQILSQTRGPPTSAHSTLLWHC